MNHAQRWLLIALLVGIGTILAFVFLQCGEGAYNSLNGNRIAIFVFHKDSSQSLFPSDYGLFTMNGIPGILLGLIAPICLFVGAAFVFLGIKAK